MRSVKEYERLETDGLTENVAFIQYGSYIFL